MLLFIPQNADASTPIFTWIHGGSNWMGSVSMPGLDGFALAGKGQIVVLPQYRLGLLGMMPPSSHPTSLDPNLAVRDLAFMLKTIHDNIGTQGNAGAITISGHSSGAAMLRSLWQVPSAPGLYHQVIVHSDPSVFPTSSMEQHKVVRDKVYSFNMFKGSKTLQSLKELDVRAFQHAIDQLMAWSGSVNTPTDILNPVFGTMTIPYEPTRALHGDGHLSVRPRDVPMLISTTKDDGGYVVSSNHHQPLSVALDSDGLSPFLRALAGRCANDPTSQPFISEEKYRIGSYTDGPDVGRVALTDIITDGAFRCVGRDTASHWAKAGGKTYVVEINDSAPYLWSSMVGNDWCIGRVCHGVSQQRQASADRRMTFPTSSATTTAPHPVSATRSPTSGQLSSKEGASASTPTSPMLISKTPMSRSSAVAVVKPPIARLTSGALNAPGHGKENEADSSSRDPAFYAFNFTIT